VKSLGYGHFKSLWTGGSAPLLSRDNSGTHGVDPFEVEIAIERHIRSKLPAKLKL
jgi:hypothetical protein